jgi:peptide/nickel transport system permease protein
MERLSWYILRRLLVVAIGVLVILTAEFCLFRVLPDDPVRLAAPPWPSGVPNDISEQYAEVIDMFEQPLYVQYFQFIGDMLTGDFGFSFLHKSDVSDYVYSAMWRTLILFGASLSLCLIIGSLAARAMSMIKSYFVKRTLFLASLALFSLPVAAWQWFLQRYLSLEWGLLPHGGIAPLDSSGIHLKYLIMPLATVFLASIGGFILSIRDGQTKASTAMSPERLTLRDGLFAALPNIQFMVAASLTFVVSAEWWFEFYGLGWYFIDSLYRMNYFWLQASFFLLAMTRSLPS